MVLSKGLNSLARFVVWRGIQVTNNNPPRVGRLARKPVFLDIHHEQNYVNSMLFLEQYKAPANTNKHKKYQEQEKAFPEFFRPVCPLVSSFFFFFLSSGRREKIDLSPITLPPRTEMRVRRHVVPFLLCCRTQHHNCGLQ